MHESAIVNAMKACNDAIVFDATQLAEASQLAASRVVQVCDKSPLIEKCEWLLFDFKAAWLTSVQ